MFKIIIADDEKKICSLIQALGDWEELQIEIVAVCNDGLEALQMINKHQPDIILTDIEMPVYSGLELINMARDEGSTGAFILISGCKQFEYVHEAMSFGVTDYILKPIDAQVLNQTLKATCSKIISKNKNKQDTKMLEQLVKDKRIQLQKKLFYNLQKYPEEFQVLREEINTRYETNFREGVYRCILINTNVSNLHLEDTLFQKKLLTIIEENFTDCFEKVEMAAKEGVYCILNYPVEKEADIKTDIYKIFEEIKKLVEIFCDFSVIIAVGKEVYELRSSSQSIDTAKLCESYKFVYQADKVIEYKASAEMHIVLSDVIPDSELKRLSLFLEIMDLDQMKEWFFNIANLVRNNKEFHPNVIYLLRDAIIKVMVDFMDKFNPGNTKQLIEDVLFESNHIMNPERLLVAIKNNMIILMERLIAESENEANRPIRIAKQYIYDNLNKTLTLEDVAGQVDLSPTYFSKLFKKEVGQNFLEYVTDIKLAQSKELLRNTNDTVAQIAYKVGYTDEKYFSKLFKKINGIKPTEFRRLYS